MPHIFQGSVEVVGIAPLQHTMYSPGAESQPQSTPEEGGLRFFFLAEGDFDGALHIFEGSGRIPLARE